MQRWKREKDESEEVVWAIGLAREKIIQLGDESGGQIRYPYFSSRYNNTSDAVGMVSRH